MRVRLLTNATMLLLAAMAAKAAWAQNATTSPLNHAAFFAVSGSFQVSGTTLQMPAVFNRARSFPGDGFLAATKLRHVHGSLILAPRGSTGAELVINGKASWSIGAGWQVGVLGVWGALQGGHLLTITEATESGPHVLLDIQQYGPFTEFLASQVSPYPPTVPAHLTSGGNGGVITGSLVGGGPLGPIDGGQNQLLFHNGHVTVVVNKVTPYQNPSCNSSGSCPPQRTGVNVALIDINLENVAGRLSADTSRYFAKPSQQTSPQARQNLHRRPPHIDKSCRPFEAGARTLPLPTRDLL